MMDEPWTVRRLRAWIAPHLKGRGVDSPQACADLLLAHALGCERLALYMDADRPASARELAVLRALVKRAADGEPVQYLVGSWGFFGHDFEVDPSTLIPRPSTETLVEQGLACLRAHGEAAPSQARRTIVDLCTGTGCVAISIAAALCAAARPRRALAWNSTSANAAPSHQSDDANALIIGIDVVPGAIELARRNAQRIGVASAVEFQLGDLDAPLAGRGLEGRVDLLVANPPYISDAEWVEVPRNVREFEPASALRGGVDGLDFIRRILRIGPRWLGRGGSVAVEIAASQGESARALAAADRYEEIRVVKDLEGHDRVLVARAPGASEA
jgi:release factor glutamine methyltransferase